MDDADKAQDHIERESPAVLRQRRPEGPIPNGRCHWCDEVVGDYDRWCDSGCREQWEHERLAMARIGRQT